MTSLANARQCESTQKCFPKNHFGADFGAPARADQDAGETPWHKRQRPWTSPARVVAPTGVVPKCFPKIPLGHCSGLSLRGTDRLADAIRSRARGLLQGTSPCEENPGAQRAGLDAPFCRRSWGTTDHESRHLESRTCSTGAGSPHQLTMFSENSSPRCPTPCEPACGDPPASTLQARVDPNPSSSSHTSPTCGAPATL